MAMEAPDSAASEEEAPTRDRIRDAALRLFADRGVDGASIRDIAREAGISSGLIRHHFGSKDALRDACDAYAIDQLMRIKRQIVDEDRLTEPGFFPDIQPTRLLLHRYLGRAMVDNSPSATAMFDRLVDTTEQWLIRNEPHPFADVRAYAAVFVGTQIGLLVMYDQVHRALGTDASDVQGNLRISMASADMHSHALLDPDQAARIRDAYEYLSTHRPDSGPQAAG
ncbi:TetR family transcriptional regulator [Actinomadura sp. 7K507]|uniref:TetR/AcrR family transcriptional regulator n=1 Tax=Actinomadura sp. 7K507 TaxID=2530365 RepID=UPI00104357E1|nr:TetR family transcriptional regulator [Actinomadura sp. 7K507]TDC77398.1 TetR/AcrR family transcriptional regulator [Actinomadura sp. 7K507]